jgi:hypothetical protein
MRRQEPTWRPAAAFAAQCIFLSQPHVYTWGYMPLPLSRHRAHIVKFLSKKDVRKSMSPHLR